MMVSPPEYEKEKERHLRQWYLHTDPLVIPSEPLADDDNMIAESGSGSGTELESESESRLRSLSQSESTPIPQPISSALLSRSGTNSGSGKDESGLVSRLPNKIRKSDSTSILSRSASLSRKSQKISSVQKSTLNAFLGIKSEPIISLSDPAPLGDNIDRDNIVDTKEPPTSLVVKLSLPSLIVKLKFPTVEAQNPSACISSDGRGLLRQASENNDDTAVSASDIQEDHVISRAATGSPHPFFLRKSEKRNVEPEPVRSNIESVESVSEEKKPVPIHTFFSRRVIRNNESEDRIDKENASTGSTNDNNDTITHSREPVLQSHSFFRKRTIKPELEEQPHRNYSSPQPSSGHEDTVVFDRPSFQSPSVPRLSSLFHTGLYSAWPKYLHTHGFDDHEMSTLTSIQDRSAFQSKKQKRKTREIVIGSNENVVGNYFPANRISSHGELEEEVHEPQRIFLDESEIQYLARSTVTIPTNINILSSLIERCGKPSAFDNCSYEPHLWSSKYSPSSASSVITANRNGYNVLSWIQRKMEILKKAPSGKPLKTENKKKRPRRDNDLNDFIVDDDELNDNESDHGDNDITDVTKNGRIEATSNFLILYGPPGSGKTSAVYAAGAELGCYVFEVNSSQRRTGKDLMNLLEGMGQSHLVHSATSNQLQSQPQQNSVVLLEEVDVIYEEERSFWSGLERFTEISRRPIILTCTNPSLLPPNVTESSANGGATFLEFIPAPEELQVDALFLISLTEGHLLSRNTLRDLVRSNHRDFRLSLNDLQLWCQMGIGGRKSGIDWILTRDEKDAFNLHGKRVISKGTYVKVREEKEQDDYDPFYRNNVKSEAEQKIQENMDTMASSGIINIAQWSEIYDILSSADILSKRSHSAFTNDLHPESSEESLVGVLSTSEFSIHHDPLPFETQIYPTIIDLTTKLFDSSGTLHILSPEPPKSHIDGVTFKDALSFLGYRSDQWGTITGNTSQFDPVPVPLLSAEIIPYIRLMAKTDKKREEEFRRRRSELAISNGGSVRESRRSYAAMGLESYRRYLDSEVDLDEIIATAPPYW